MNFYDWMSLSKQIALIIFFVTFVAIVGWAYWPSNKKKFDEIGKGLLDGDEEPPIQGK